MAAQRTEPAAEAWTPGPGASQVVRDVTATTPELPEIRLAIFEHSRLVNVVDAKVSISMSCVECQYPAQLGYLGMAWADNATLHVARMKTVPLYLPERDAAPILERQLLLKKIHVPA